MILGMAATTVLSLLTTSMFRKTTRQQYELIFSFRDNDRSSLNCASMLKGGWWWKSCGRGLNGLYLNDPQDLTARQGTFNINTVVNLRLTRIFVRYCLVPLERMGLHTEESNDDDQTKRIC